MEQFERIGTLIHERWRAANFDEVVFPDIAIAALEELPPVDYVTPDDVVRWALSSCHTVPQTDPSAKFGEPPITVFFTPRFYIEILFWLDGTTQIHQHSFSGAFYVLDGSSVHTTYDFQVDDRINSNLQLGALKVLDVELLGRGNCHAIRARTLMHALFHLERPSVSIVIRTPGELENLPQLSYEPPCLAYVRQTPAMPSTKILQVLRLAIKTRQDWRGLVVDSLQRSDFETAYRIINLVFAEFNGLPAVAPFFDVMATVHGARAARIPALFEEKVRQQQIISKRASITRFEHRFFLALLLNVPTRRQLLELVGRRYPERPSVDTVMAWVAELAGPLDDTGNNLLGVPLDDTALAVLRSLLDGKRGSAVLADLVDGGFDPDNVDAEASGIGELETAYRDSLIFRRLVNE